MSRLARTAYYYRRIMAADNHDARAWRCAVAAGRLHHLELTVLLATLAGNVLDATDDWTDAERDEWVASAADHLDQKGRDE